MKFSRIRSALAVAVAVLTAVPVVASAKGETGKWLVLYKNEASRQAARSAVTALGGRVTHQFRIVPAEAAELSAAAVEALRKNPNVQVVEPDGIAYALGGAAGSVQAGLEAAQVVPYGIDMVRARQAWSTTRGAGIRVAVLDTGIDTGHPDAGNVVLTRSFVPGESVEDLGSGHGTHTSGTVGAADNDIGVVGVAPDADLLIGKVLADSGSGQFSWIVSGIDWARDNDAQVISMSLGGTSGSATLQTAVNNATAAGSLVVAAAGNSNTSAPHYPAYYDKTLAVGSVDEKKARSSFSNYGSWVDIAAPGSDVLSTVPRGKGQSANARWNNADHGANGIAGAASGTKSGTIVDCGICQPSDISGKDLSGKIAHCRRGSISFGDKVKNAQGAGAVGVIISNNAPGNFNGTLGDGVTSPAVAVSVSQEDGATIADGTSGTVSAIADDYSKFSGTSMATPHVAGVAALVFAAANGGTNSVAVSPDQVRSALLDTADPITTDQPIGKLVNAERAVAAVD